MAIPEVVIILGSKAPGRAEAKVVDREVDNRVMVNRVVVKVVMECENL